MKLRIRNLFLIPAMFAAATMTADTLILRDGRRVDGRLLSVRDGVVEFGAGGVFNGGQIIRLNRNDVLGIEFTEFDRNDRDTRSVPPSTPFGRRPSGLRERQVMVEAGVQWIDTNIDLRSGQTVYFEASGEVHWGPGRRDGPGGEESSPRNDNRPMPNRPAAALIGRVGTGAGYFFIGSERGPIRMRSSGRLFLGVNDDYLQDNSGTFRVVVYF